jgi:4-hydroxy-tetrahydrodipicolinate synthase
MRLSDGQIRERLRGVAVGLLTPFDDSLEIEYDKLADNAQALYDEGIRTFLATANISEYHSLSQDERIDIAKASVEASTYRGLNDSPSNSTNERSVPETVSRAAS